MRLVRGASSNFTVQGGSRYVGVLRGPTATCLDTKLALHQSR